MGGQIGWNADQVFESDDFVVQVNQALQNIVAILKEANAGPEHIVRLTWYVTDEGIWPGSRRWAPPTARCWESIFRL